MQLIRHKVVEQTIKRRSSSSSCSQTPCRRRSSDFLRRCWRSDRHSDRHIRPEISLDPKLLLLLLLLHLVALIDILLVDKDIHIGRFHKTEAKEMLPSHSPLLCMMRAYRHVGLNYTRQVSWIRR